jgi:hypothetical protein
VRIGENDYEYSELDFWSNWKDKDEPGFDPYFLVNLELPGGGISVGSLIILLQIQGHDWYTDILPAIDEYFYVMWGGDSGGLGFPSTLDLFLYAHYSKPDVIPQNTLTYHANGGSGTLPASVLHDRGAVTVGSGASLVRDGGAYVFDVWNTQADGNGVDYDPGDNFFLLEDANLFAQYKEAPEVPEITVTYKQDVDGKGHTAIFIAGEQASFIQLASDPIVLNPAIAEIQAGLSKTIETQRRFGPILITDREHFRFSHWTDDLDTEDDFFGTGVTVYKDADFNLYAVYDRFFTVEYRANAVLTPDSEPPPPGTMHKEGTNFTAASGAGMETMQGGVLRVFDKWRDSAQPGPGRVYYESGVSYPLNADLVLFAVYRDFDETDSASIVYHVNEGQGIAPIDPGPYLIHDTAIVMSGADLTRYVDGAINVFVEWNTEADGGGRSYREGEDIFLDRPVTNLFAIYGPPARFTVTYIRNATQGFGTVPSASEYTDGALVTVRSGASLVSVVGGRMQPFVRWNTEPDGSGTWFFPGGTFIIREDTRLYASYDPIPPATLHGTYTLTEGSSMPEEVRYAAYDTATRTLRFRNAADSPGTGSVVTGSVVLAEKYDELLVALLNLEDDLVEVNLVTFDAGNANIIAIEIVDGEIDLFDIDEEILGGIGVAVSGGDLELPGFKTQFILRGAKLLEFAANSGISLENIGGTGLNVSINPDTGALVLDDAALTTAADPLTFFAIDAPAGDVRFKIDVVIG